MEESRTRHLDEEAKTLADATISRFAASSKRRRTIALTIDDDRDLRWKRPIFCEH